jgi:lipopolysaccharide export system protein LptC
MMLKSKRRQAQGKLTLYLPIVVMSVLALGSWWLARNTPSVNEAAPPSVSRTDPDYLLSQFAIKTFDPSGALANEVWGSKARHFPHTDILEIDEARFRSSRGPRATVGQAQRAYSNADGSEVQLVGNAIVVREAGQDAQGRALPRIEFRGEFLHAFLQTEVVKSHKPVTVVRGADQFSGDTMVYNQLDGLVALDGRVRVRLEPRSASDSR